MFMYGVLYSIEISQFGGLEYVIMTFLVELGAPNLRVSQCGIYMYGMR